MPPISLAARGGRPHQCRSKPQGPKTLWSGTLTMMTAPLEKLVASDPRADGGLRQIYIEPGAISIHRRVGGVQMRLALPIGCFSGVSLALLGSARGGFYYRVALQHRDPELAVTLAESENEADIAPEWRA